jgi:hypothetical protein
MIQFAVPVVIGITKLIVNKTVAEGISDGVSEAKYEVDRKITKSLVSTLINIFINVVSLMVAIYLLPFVVDTEVVIYVVCSVYLGSILYGLYGVIVNSPLIFKFVFQHKLNLRDYVYNEIYSEAHIKARNEINTTNIIVRALNGVFGKSASDIASSIAHSTTNIVIKKVTSIVVILSIIFLAYVLIFRVLVSPILIENSTQLNVFQAAFYPLLYAVDYFFHAKLLSWLI